MHVKFSIHRKFKWCVCFTSALITGWLESSKIGCLVSNANSALPKQPPTQIMGIPSSSDMNGFEHCIFAEFTCFLCLNLVNSSRNILFCKLNTMYRRPPDNSAAVSALSFWVVAFIVRLRQRNMKPNTRCNLRKSFANLLVLIIMAYTRR